MHARQPPRLAATPVGAAVLNILDAGIAAADAGAAVASQVRLADGVLHAATTSWSLPAERLLVVGAGKASGFMAAALEDVLGQRIDGGLVIVPHGTAELDLGPVQLRRGAHPIPDRAGLEASRQLFQALETLGRRDGAIVVISGGASALLELPIEPVSLEALALIGNRLLRCGAPIHEVNAVRTLCSRIKGGGLARAASPARMLSLIVSDVPGDDVRVIGSGPTAAPCAGAAQSTAIARRLGLAGNIPEPVLAAVGRVRDRMPQEHPANVINLVIANNATALSGCAKRAAQLGYQASAPVAVSGEPRQAAARLIEGLALRPGHCRLGGGETTVTVRGTGTGGRNQEFALAMAILLDGRSGVCFASVGTDGVDGPTEAAGGLIDGSTAARIRAAGIDPAGALQDNDSHAALAASGDLVVTGPTRTNVMDLQVLLATEVV